MSDIPHTHSNPGEELTDHSYDGIQEYDNPTPPWWTYLFLGTIVFSGAYLVLHLMTMGQLGPEPTFKADMVAAMKLQYGQLGDIKPTPASIAMLSADEKWNGVGKSLFIGNCASCHGQDGSGISAPNLTDDFYVNVKKVEDIADVVANGRKNGAMPAWNNRMLPVEQVLVSAYVASLRGKNLASVGNRPAEGEKIPAFETK